MIRFLTLTAATAAVLLPAALFAAPRRQGEAGREARRPGLPGDRRDHRVGQGRRRLQRL